MEMRQLMAFREVARCKSFSQAAHRLGYVQSSVSAQVQGLERELDVRLFDRLGRQVALTSAGAALLPHVERLLEVADEARHVVNMVRSNDGDVAGSLVISAPESLLTYRLPSVLSLFRARYPRVETIIRPMVVGRLRGEVRRAVNEGSVDVAFVLDAPLKIAGLAIEELAQEPISLIAPQGHHLAGRRSVGPADLAGEPLLLPEAPDSGCVYRRQFEQQLGGVGVSPGETLEFASIEAVKQCVVAGMGLSVLPTVAVQAEVEAGRLVVLAWREPFRVRTQMVWHAKRWVSPALAAFLDTARAAFEPQRLEAITGPAA
jgi:DNA-binding transcriptional LysR family regulator